jgi:hypothetical protein
LDIVVSTALSVAFNDGEAGNVLNSPELKLHEVLAFPQRLNKKVSVLVSSCTSCEQITPVDALCLN